MNAMVEGSKYYAGGRLVKYSLEEWLYQLGLG